MEMEIIQILHFCSKPKVCYEKLCSLNKGNLPYCKWVEKKLLEVLNCILVP